MKIFISSPGDVDKERRIAECLINRLVEEFAGRISIVTIPEYRAREAEAEKHATQPAGH